MRHSPSASTSGIAVETTCKPAARYSRALSGFAFNVSSLTRNGINATSKPLQYAGSAPYGLRPSRWTLGRRSSAEMSVVTLPSATSDPVEKRSATLRSEERRVGKSVDLGENQNMNRKRTQE